MLINPTIDMLRELGLYGMATAFHELDAQSEVRGLEHGEWLAMLLEREATMRRQKRFEARARAAKLRHDAQIENADFRAARGLDRNLYMALAGCEWIRKHHGLLVTGPAGVCGLLAGWFLSARWPANSRRVPEARRDPPPVRQGLSVAPPAIFLLDLIDHRQLVFPSCPVEVLTAAGPKFLDKHLLHRISRNELVRSKPNSRSQRSFTR